MTDPIAIACPRCTAVLGARPRHLGRLVTCRACRARFVARATTEADRSARAPFDASDADLLAVGAAPTRRRTDRAAPAAVTSARAVARGHAAEGRVPARSAALGVREGDDETAVVAAPRGTARAVNAGGASRPRSAPSGGGAGRARSASPDAAPAPGTPSRGSQAARSRRSTIGNLGLYGALGYYVVAGVAWVAGPRASAGDARPAAASVDPLPDGVRAGGRFHGGTYANPALGLRLDLPAEDWRAVGYEGRDLATFVPRRGPGRLTLRVEPRGGRDLLTAAEATDLAEGPRSCFRPQERALGRLGDLPAVRTRQETALPAGVPVIVHEQAVLEHGAWLVFVGWAADEGTRGPWDLVGAGLRLGGDAASDLPASGPLRPTTEAAERARVEATSAFDGATWRNDALGVRVAVPAGYVFDRSASPARGLEAEHPRGRLSIRLEAGSLAHPAAILAAHEGGGAARVTLHGHAAALAEARGLLGARAVTVAVVVDGHVVVVRWAGDDPAMTPERLRAAVDLRLRPSS